MAPAIQLTLESLIPRHSGALPRELNDLASSLLAQSYSKISNLKSEEEIARMFACAHIACERLKTTLNLPKIEPNPPIPPRVYTKLFAYFDKTLVSASTIRKRARQEEQRIEEKRKLPERYGPTQEKSLEGFRSNRTPKRGLRHGGMNKDATLPKWVGPAIRVLCKELDAGKAVPHVYAGVESVSFMPCPNGEEERMTRKMPALVAAIWFFVVIRMAGQKKDQKEFNEERRKVLGILRNLKENKEVVGKLGKDDSAWDGWEVNSKSDVDDWLKELTDKGWLGLEWYENLEDGMGATGDIEEGPEEEEEEAREVEDSERAKKRKREWGQNMGRGTMKQDQFDYLSPEQRKDYTDWVGQIMAHIDEKLAEGKLYDKMDMTEG